MTTTPEDQPSPVDALAEARRALQELRDFTVSVTAQLNTKTVMPQVETQWRRHQDGLMELARTSALVSIAQSLDRIAQKA